MISCVLLSAGLSLRFGSAKALAQLNGEIVIERLQKMLINSQVDEIIVVLGAHAELIKLHILNHIKIKFVYNKDYNFGQTSSFKEGLRNISKNVQAIALLPVDYPIVCGETINSLIRTYRDQSPAILIPSFQGKKGHPPFFDVRLKDKFLTLDNECGINVVAHDYQADTVILPVEDPGVVVSFNTQDELNTIKQYNS